VHQKNIVLINTIILLENLGHLGSWTWQTWGINLWKLESV